MDLSNKISLIIALGCLLFVVYDARRPRTFSESETIQLEEIVQRSIDTHLAVFNSELEVQANALLRQKRTILTLDAKKKNIDDLVMTGVRIASDAQAWKLKPPAFGGGRDQVDFHGLTLEQLGYPVDGADRYSSASGICEVRVQPKREVLEVICSNEAMGNVVYITLTGTRPEQIQTRILNTGQSDTP